MVAESIRRGRVRRLVGEAASPKVLQLVFDPFAHRREPCFRRPDGVIAGPAGSPLCAIAYAVLSQIFRRTAISRRIMSSLVPALKGVSA